MTIIINTRNIVAPSSTRLKLVNLSVIGGAQAIFCIPKPTASNNRNSRIEGLAKRSLLLQ